MEIEISWSMRDKQGVFTLPNSSNARISVEIERETGVTLPISFAVSGLAVERNVTNNFGELNFIVREK